MARLSIVALVDAFAAAMAAVLARHGTDGAAFFSGWADWTVLAAQLAELRSRLLSRTETGAVADWLERRHQLGRNVFATRGLDSGIGGLVAGQEDRAVLPRAGDGDVAKLFRACLVALRVPHPARPAAEEGRCGTMTHDYKRNGTTTLFAALNVLEGSVIGRCMQRHRHQEFIRFLNAIEAEVPAAKQVHVVLDNYAAHKHPKVVEWLGRHPRFTFHFTPTSASWINAVEGFFAKLTKQRLKRGVFHSLVALQAAIKRFVAEANANPKPFCWTKDPDKIMPPSGVGTKR